jgi:8-oxo-dGTP pyrophosphatase MutT (NUDIX family)
MTVREDLVRRSDGTEGIYGVVEKPDFSLVLPRDAGGFWMVEQYRYPVARRGWEFPMGSWSGDAEGEPGALARSELTEETGLRAESWRHLGHLLQACGYATQGFDVFLATGLTSGDPTRELTEQDMVHRFVTDAEVATMIRTGDIVDSASLAALTLFNLVAT